MSIKSQSQRHIVGIHYILGPKIGEGSFGVIFEGENILNDTIRDPVAIKFEPRNSDAPQLRDEFRAYRILNDCVGIPHAYYYGQEGMHNVLVIDLLGPSLEDLFEWCGRKFSIKTTVLLAKQMIKRLKEIHEHDLIYRDIKPDNFLIAQFQTMSQSMKRITKSAYSDPNLIYMVDFGMAKQYRDPRTKQHIPYRERKSLSGTARYMSINTHFGREQSRRDDLESLGHVFFYFLRGSLPWQGLKAPNSKLKYEKIGLTKQKIHPNDLLLNNNLPRQFATFLSYARSLKFEETPNYDYLISLMDQILEEHHLIDDGHYDWMDLNEGKGWDININKRANLHGYGNPTPKNNNRGGDNNNSKNGKQSKQFRKTFINSSTQELNNNSSNLNTDSNHYHRQQKLSSRSKIYDSMGQRNTYYYSNENNNNSNTNLSDNHYNNKSHTHSYDNYQQLYHHDNFVNNNNNNNLNNQDKSILSKICCCLWC